MTQLSVIIPSYNAAKYITDAVASIFADVPDAEIIVIDDASTDDTVEALELCSDAKVKLTLSAIPATLVGDWPLETAVSVLSAR